MSSGLSSENSGIYYGKISYRVAHSSLNNTTGLVDGLDTNLELVDVIQRIKYSEDINSALIVCQHKFEFLCRGGGGRGETYVLTPSQYMSLLLSAP